MKKSITKKKRPKSVLAKAWETRRAAKAIKAVSEMIPPSRFTQGATVSPAKATQTSETATHRSEVDAIANVLDVNRDEILCSFLGDISTLRMSDQLKGHYPIMVSRVHINAIEDFLTAHGYGPWGKGSGSLMSVSTNPNAN